LAVVDAAFPPLDFPLYGLGADWTGPRWLDFLDGQIGRPAWGAWLAHGYDAERGSDQPWVIVGSMRRPDGFEVRLLGPDETFEHYLAFTATHALWSDSREARSALEVEPGRWQDWPTVAFAVNGSVITGHLLRRGRTWAAFSSDTSEVGLVVHAGGVRVTELSLVEITETWPYHFDRQEPLHYPEVHERSRRLALGY